MTDSTKPGAGAVVTRERIRQFALRGRCLSWHHTVALLDELDARDAEVERLQRELAEAKAGLASAWEDGCEYALEASGHAVSDAPAVYAANPYRPPPHPQ
jgi:hypothetical protein